MGKNVVLIFFLAVWLVILAQLMDKNPVIFWIALVVTAIVVIIGIIRQNGGEN